ncbi:MAG TPA: low molecular weight protein-tyrosine-phosphatase [Chitinophagaceae bacterium]|nr:low molecular weight protein-tyrosine-phosphatase [Chitinophagaceae bacterium]
MKILMVCLGNICRSPLAEGILQDKVKKRGLQWIVDSAGTERYHIGEPPHPLSQKVASQHGIDISHQRARRFKAADIDQFDIVFALAKDVLEEIKHLSASRFNAHKVKLLMEELYPGEERDVPDPWYGPEPGYQDAYEIIERACEAVIQNYTIKV